MNNLLNFQDVRLILFDFDGVFTDNKVIVSENGIESVICCRSDGIGLSRIVNLGIKVAIVSTESNPVVKERASKLKIPCYQNVEDKAVIVDEICDDWEVDIKKTMFVGNDINDIPALEKVGFPVGVADSYPEIDSYIMYKCKKNGGDGAVREICDMLYYSLISAHE